MLDIEQAEVAPIEKNIVTSKSSKNVIIALVAAAILIAGGAFVYANGFMEADKEPPAVSIAQPDDNSSYTLVSANQSLKEVIDIRAEDNVKVKKVELFIDDDMVRTFTDEPYYYNLKINTPGNYLITAKAYDEANNVTSSRARFKVAQAQTTIDTGGQTTIKVIDTPRSQSDIDNYSLNHSESLTLRDLSNEKDSYDSRITDLSQQINNRISKTSGPYSGQIYNDLTSLLNEEESLLRRVNSQVFSGVALDMNLKNQLAQLVNLEITRTDSLISGIIAGGNGYDYKPAFQIGHNAKEKYTKLNVQFESALDGYVYNYRN
jgi:hypothetical protein